MIELHDRFVLITGASRGIGAACARSFARSGASVMVHYRQAADAAQRLLDELDSFDGQRHSSSRADLQDPESVAALFEHVRAEWGRLDCLVNNAGIWIRHPLTDLDVRKLEETWRINERGPFLCAHHAIPLLEHSPDGNIVNISSTAGQRGEAFYSPYASSKGAMIAVTKSWSSELAPKIRVNSVAPGWVDTDMAAESLTGDGRRSIESTIPLGRVADPDDIAGPVVFLASPLARHVTGEILNVNGGSVLAG